MLDAEDADYFDVQGTMLIDAAIGHDVTLVECRSKFPHHHSPLSSVQRQVKILIDEDSI